MYQVNILRNRRAIQWQQRQYEDNWFQADPGNVVRHVSEETSHSGADL